MTEAVIVANKGTQDTTIITDQLCDSHLAMSGEAYQTDTSNHSRQSQGQYLMIKKLEQTRDNHLLCPYQLPVELLLVTIEEILCKENR